MDNFVKKEVDMYAASSIKTVVLLDAIQKCLEWMRNVSKANISILQMLQTVNNFARKVTVHSSKMIFWVTNNVVKKLLLLIINVQNNPLLISLHVEKIPLLGKLSVLSIIMLENDKKIAHQNLHKLILCLFVVMIKLFKLFNSS